MLLRAATAVMMPVLVLSDCKSVQQGHYYANALNVPDFLGFRSGDQEATVTFHSNAVEYLFPPDPICSGDEGDVSCYMCQISWNKLYGASRCGSSQPHHQDSDRFVWRRHPDCVRHTGDVVLGEVENCSKSGQIQLAAAAYDGGVRPYGNDSLFYQFDTAVRVGVPLTLRLSYAQDSTFYSLLDAPGGAVIESHVIQHRSCDKYAQGYNLGLYFGGQCAEPGADGVTVCYEDGAGGVLPNLV